MWELDYKESWAPKNWCFWTVVLENTLESPLDCKEIQPVHPKGDSPGCSLEGLMLKLKLQYFGHLMRSADLLEKTLMLGKIEGMRRRGWDGGMASLIHWIWVWVSSGRWWRTGRRAVVHGVAKSRTRLSDWTDWAELEKPKKLRSWHLVPSLHGKQMGKQWKQGQTLFSWAPKSLQPWLTATMKLKDACSLEEKLWST